MRNSDLRIVLSISSIYPDILPHLLSIYKLGHKQGTIDALIKQLETK